jgi:membrane associated rhomboid family serine protease
MKQLPPEKAVVENPPAFNVPGPLLLLVGLLAAVHLWRSYGLGLWSPDDLQILREFAFIPARVTAALGFMSPAELLTRLPVEELRLKSALIKVLFPGQSARLWTFVTSAFLHGGKEHLILNSLWLVIFGTPVIRRLGTVRFAILFVLSAAAGSLLFLVIKPYDIVVLVGASGAVSGLTAAAMRFCFTESGFMPDKSALYRPALSLSATFRHRAPLTFFIVWLAINLIMGLLGSSMPGGSEIAWQAHLGGFAAGLLLFGLLDRHSPRRESASLS